MVTGALVLGEDVMMTTFGAGYCDTGAVLAVAAAFEPYG
jgi:hypothetical protein